jgi:hypothetical protein
MDTPADPQYPVYALTTSEICRYRRELEQAIQRLGQAPGVADLRTKLDQVLAEQESRTRLRRANGRS